MFWFFDELAAPHMILVPPVLCTIGAFLWLGRTWGGALLAGLVGALSGAILYMILLIERTLSIYPDSVFALAPLGVVLALIPYMPACLILSLALYVVRIQWRRVPGRPAP